MLAAYVTVLFGTLSLGSIFRRSFDPALTIEQDEDDRPSARRLRSKLAAFRNLREPEKSNFLQMDELSMPSHQTASGSGPDAVASGGSERVKTTTVVNEGRKSRTTSLSQSSPTRAPVGRPPSPPAQPAQAAQPAQPVFYPTPFGRIAGSSAAVPSSTAVSPQQTDVTFAEPLVIRRRQEVYAAQFAQASPSAHGAWRRASVGVASPNRGGGGNGAVSAQRPDQAVRSQADVPSSHESLVRTNSGASGDDVVDADMIKVASPKAAAIKRSRSHLEHSHSRKRSEEDASGAGGSRHRLTKNFALHLRDDDISRMKDQETFFV